MCRFKVFLFLTDGQHNEVTFTYAELDRQARHIAALLQQRFTPGDRVLLLYQPGLEYIAAVFGCFYAGMVAVPAYPPRLNHNLIRIEAIIHDANASVALTNQTVFAGLQRKFEQNPLIQRFQWIVTDMGSTDMLAEQWQIPNVVGDTLALLQYTSGSTGTPKGVMITHDNLLQNAAIIQRGMDLTSDDRGMSWLPPYHDMGLISILESVYLGANMVLMSPTAFLQQPLRWLKVISRYRVTNSGGPNFALDLCVRKATPEVVAELDLSHWDVAFTGSEPVNAATLEAFARTFAPSGFRSTALYPCYGMAETTLFISGGQKHKVPLVLCQPSIER